MDKLRIISLYDIYGKLLTKNQAKMFELYYMCDLSLREIAQNEYVTFQAVRSALKTAEKQLEKFESMLHMNEYKKLAKQLEEAISKESIKNKEIYDILDKLN